MSDVKLYNLNLEMSTSRIRELEAEVERLRGLINEIATAKQDWRDGVGSYAGGETNSGFASRLQGTAARALRGE